MVAQLEACNVHDGCLCGNKCGQVIGYIYLRVLSVALSTSGHGSSVVLSAYAT